MTAVASKLHKHLLATGRHKRTQDGGVSDFQYLSQKYVAAVELLQGSEPEWRELAAEGVRSLLPAQACYDELLRRHDGDPSGVEFRHHSDARYAFVLADASEPGNWRIQFFDADGFSSHESYAELHEAVFEMVWQGFAQEDKGALSRLSGTPRWRTGQEIAALMQRFGRGELSYRELDSEIARLRQPRGMKRGGRKGKGAPTAPALG